VGHLSICDFDRVDPTNLPRQILYRDSDVGKAKAHVATERLQEINPALRCDALEQRLDRTELVAIIETVDLVLDCTDNFATRWLINEVCQQSETPLVSGAAIRLEGQVSVFRHDDTGPCFRCLYDEADENLNDCAGQGILAPVAGTVGTMMATEAIKLILDIKSELDGSLWTYDGLTGRTRLIRIPRRDDCPVCADPLN
jgi:adenylyltransferase/sulfurtransferase